MKTRLKRVTVTSGNVTRPRLRYHSGCPELADALNTVTRVTQFSQIDVSIYACMGSVDTFRKSDVTRYRFILETVKDCLHNGNVSCFSNVTSVTGNIVNWIECFLGYLLHSMRAYRGGFKIEHILQG